MTLTLLLMTARQHCRLLRGRRCPTSSPTCLLAVWLVSVCAALPHIVYTNYLDMEVSYRVNLRHGSDFSYYDSNRQIKMVVYTTAVCLVNRKCPAIPAQLVECWYSSTKSPAG